MKLYHPRNPRPDTMEPAPSVFLYTLWRSGTHWVGEMLSEMTGFTCYYQSEDGASYSDETLEQLQQFRTNTVLVRHICLPCEKLLPRLRELGLKTVVLYRDPRDVLVSNIHMRKYREGYRKNLPPFPDMPFGTILKWELDTYRHTYRDSLPAWATVSDPIIHQVRYEDLRADTVAGLRRLAEFLQITISDAELATISAMHSFQAKTGRTAGTEDKKAHNRKGIVGDHKNQLTQDESRLVNDYMRDSLVRMRYSIDEPVNSGEPSC